MAAKRKAAAAPTADANGGTGNGMAALVKDVLAGWHPLGSMDADAGGKVFVVE
jgi:hypothetical protein